MHISEQQQQQEQTAATNGGGGGGEAVKAADKKQEARDPAEAEGVNGKSNGSASATPGVTEGTGSAPKPEAEVPTVDNLIQMEEEEGEEAEDGQTTPVEASEPPSAAAVAAATAAAAAAATAATAAAASESSVVVVTPTSPRSITTASMSASGESIAKPNVSNIVLMGDFFPIFLAGGFWLRFPAARRR